MRGVQAVVQRLITAKVISIEGNKEMSLKRDVDTDDELERLVFPEEFVSPDSLEKPPNSDDELEELLKAGGESDEEPELADLGQSGDEATPPPKPKKPLRGSLLP